MRLTAVCLAFVFCSGTAAAQTPSDLAGARVRVTVQRPDAHDRERRTGALLAFNDSLRLATATDTLVEPRAHVVGLELMTGRSHAGGIGRGAGLGALVGLVVGGAKGYTEGNDGFFTAEEKMVLSGLAFGAIGIVVGAIVGAGAPTERWQALEPDAIRLGLEAADGGPLLTLRLRAP